MFVKNLTSTITGKISSRYNDVSPEIKSKSTDINILLNRVRADKKKEKLETLGIIFLVSLSVLATGLIVSL